MLTKSGFLEFQHCPKSFWLAKHRPELIEAVPLSAFAQKIFADGHEVERAFGEYVTHWPDAARISGQVTYAAADLSARADFVRTNADGSIDIFEVKGSTSVKPEHIADAAFQTIVAERAGKPVKAAYVVHLNRDYIRRGALDPAGLFCIVDVSAQVAQARAEIEQQIGEAVTLLAAEAIDEAGCGCIYFGNPEKRCGGFGHLNPGLPEVSIYLLPRISPARMKTFVDSGRFLLAEIDPQELTDRQKPVHQAAGQGAPVIDKAAIAAFLQSVEWPIHFYDYETCNPPIPVVDGHRPMQQIPVQFSLHVLHEDGRLDHQEWLSAGFGEERALVDSLASGIGDRGSAIVWFATFEKSRNRELGEAIPDMAAFFDDLSNRTIDLMRPFETAYVDIKFRGSTSIKKVLPVVCPELQYDQKAVHDGTGAIEAWTRMVASSDQAQRERLRAELLAYCKLDTLAMAEIFRFLQRVVA